MDHQWRAPPLPIHGKICPLCSTSHFPFCPPNHNSSFPPNLDRMHMQTPSPASSYTMLDPSHAPRYWESNPNFNATHSQYHIQPPRDLANANYTRGPHLNQRFDYGANAIGMGSDYSLNDRSSKRLKMDGTHLASYATDAYLNPSMPSAGEDERILKLIHDHGGALNGTAPSGQDHYPSFHETSANHASNLPNGYQLNSQPGHLHTQSYGYLNTPYGPNEASGEKFYSHTFQHPHYVRRANTVEEIHSLGCHAPPQTMEGCQVPGSYPSFSASSQYSIPQNGSHYPPTEEIDTWPPLPTSPPPPLPSDTPGHWITHPKHSPAPCKMSSSLFPVDSSSSKFAHSSYPPVPEAHSLAPPHHHNSQSVHSSSGLFPKDSHGPQTAMYQHIVQDQPVLSKYNVSDKPKIIDAISLFKLPNRDRRPDHFVIILRGLPGSGKSYLARMLRDLEIEHGGKAPRIHSMDDYFMTEVDKVEENETSVRGKKPVLKKVLEYCYEPEMEEAYRSSMLKAFKKTLDEGSFTIVIVDDRNLRVADFTQFWATAKRSGYEVYLLETSYKDPVGCTARNIHGFTRDAVEKMAQLWEEAPPLYLQLDAKSLLHGDDSKESNIQEVDMDMDEEDLDKGSFELEETKQENVIVKTLEEIGYDGSKDKKTLEAEADHPDEEIKDLRSSKWSGDLDVDNIKGSDNARGKSAAISGLFKAYGKEGKSVRWGDQVPNTGFSIGAMKKANVTSLIIGPGSGYNLKSNPLRVEESKAIAEKNGDRKKHNIFEEHLRAEKESFKAVFDRRRQRIGGLDQEED